MRRMDGGREGRRQGGTDGRGATRGSSEIRAQQPDDIACRCSPRVRAYLPARTRRAWIARARERARTRARLQIDIAGRMRRLPNKAAERFRARVYVSIKASALFQIRSAARERLPCVYAC